MNSDTSTHLLQQLMPPCFLTTACMLSDILVHYYLACSLLYESPLGFQVMEKSSQVISHGKKPQTVGFMDLECNKNNLKQLG